MRLRPRPSAGGYTLFEVLIVLAIVVGLVGIMGVGVRSLRKSDLRSASTQLAGAIKFTYDRAVATGKYYRLVIDIDEKRFWPEMSEDRFYLVRERDRGRRPPEDEGEDRPGTTPRPSAGTPPAAAGGLGGLLGGLGGSPGGTGAAPRVGTGKARFAAVETEKQQRSAPLRGVTIAGVWTPRHDEPLTQGRAYLYFYPEGMGERAIIHLSDGGAVYSLVAHPLTGRVQVVNERVEPPREGDVDDEGQSRQ